MEIDAEAIAAPSPSERIYTHLETRVPDCNLSILGRALLIETYGQAEETAITALLALSPSGFARVATQCSAEAGPEWDHVGSLDVELHRDWLLCETHLADLHLDLFRERGPTRPPLSFGRVYVPGLEKIMWPSSFLAYSTPPSTDTGLLEAMPDGLSRPYYPCEEPPCRQRFVDVTLRTRLLQLPMAVREGLRYGCAGLATVVILGVALSPILLMSLRFWGIGPPLDIIFVYSCLHSRYLDKCISRFWWVIHQLGFFLDFEYPED